jgi:hypothetical protein
VLNLFYLTRKLDSIYNFRYIVECYRKRLIKIRNNIGVYESIRKLITFSSSIIVNIYYRRL